MVSFDTSSTNSFAPSKPQKKGYGSGKKARFSLLKNDPKTLCHLHYQYEVIYMPFMLPWSL